jgi:hypothetical protein
MGFVVTEEAFRLITGEPHLAQSTGDSGRVSNRWMCRDCGSWLTGSPRLGGMLRSVRAGTLDDTSWLQPTAHIWTRSKQPWIALPSETAASRRSQKIWSGSSPPVERARNPRSALEIVQGLFFSPGQDLETASASTRFAPARWTNLSDRSDFRSSIRILIPRFETSQAFCRFGRSQLRRGTDLPQASPLTTEAR